MPDTSLHSLAEFRHQIRRFLSFSRRAARAAGLDPQQHQMLLAIAGAPAGQSTHIGYLAQRLFLHHNTAVELVNRLERKRLARRLPSPSDGRRVLVAVTPRGQRILSTLTRHHLTELRSAGPSLIRSLQVVLADSRNQRRPRHARRSSR